MNIYFCESYNKTGISLLMYISDIALHGLGVTEGAVAGISLFVVFSSMNVSYSSLHFLPLGCSFHPAVWLFNLSCVRWNLFDRVIVT